MSIENEGEHVFRRDFFVTLDDVIGCIVLFAYYAYRAHRTETCS